MSNSVVLCPSYWAFVSGGKDSAFMLNLILQNRHLYKLDGVINLDLEIDYPFIKNVVDYMEKQCLKYGIKFVRIKPRVKWSDLYNKYGYPDRIVRWCNSCYKLDGEKQLKEFLRSQNMFLVKYIGICYDETSRIKSDSNIVYPLVDFKVNEDTILKWAQTQPIFNDFYLFNRRCGCMGCPMSSINELVYLKKYYPDKFDYFMNLALNTEKNLAIKLNKPYSLWGSNPKYDTNYRINRVNQIISQTTLF